MDISPGSGNGSDLVMGLERDASTGREATVAETTIRRERSAQSDIMVAVRPTGNAGNHAALQRDADVGRSGSDLLHEGDRPALADSLECLLVDARNACRRDGVAATRRELSARVAKRIGVSQAEVARHMRGRARRGSHASAQAASRQCRLHDPIPELVLTILGAREREVFLARRDAQPDDIAALHELASRLQISVERVYQLEVSARRKLARALA